jgi:hypothetical protein
MVRRIALSRLRIAVMSVRVFKRSFWMASQCIEAFTASELGSTVASMAATEFVLGHEDRVGEKVRMLFDLAEDEASALTPPVPGRAVLITRNERTVVHVMPSPILWPFVATGEADSA